MRLTQGDSKCGLTVSQGERMETYCPRLRERRARQGRLHEVIKPLFVGYTFVLIRLQWQAARWAPGTLGLIMDGERRARFPDAVIAEIRARERNGAVELPPRPPLATE
jgi:hypothetical protein